MKILATYCSAQKDEQSGSLPAYQRYQSDRINMVMARSELQDFPFMILSGKFGLIEYDQPLPYYDHLLRSFEVEQHANFVAVQIREYNITEIEFYSRSLEEDPNLQAYHDCIMTAGKMTGIRVSILIIK